jgi:hypothetical protein
MKASKPHSGGSSWDRQLSDLFLRRSSHRPKLHAVLTVVKQVYTIKLSITSIGHDVHINAESMSTSIVACILVVQRACLASLCIRMAVSSGSNIPAVRCWGEHKQTQNTAT